MLAFVKRSPFRLCMALRFGSSDARFMRPEFLWLE
jgi:hypothetical protein